jgi:hypothetical protein
VGVWLVLGLVAVGLVGSGCTFSVEPGPAVESSAAGAPEQAYPAAPTAASGWFDECGVLTRADLGGDFGIRIRTATPQPRGWLLECGYAADGGVTEGFGEVDVSIDTETEGSFVVPKPKLTEAADGSPLAHAVPEPIPGLGDQSYVRVEYDTRDNGEIYALAVTVGFRTGRHEVHLTHQRARAEPEIGTAIKLARQVVRRLPANPRVPPRLVSGPCDRIDLGAAGEVLGEELAGARQLDDPSGHYVVCKFAGQAATLSVSLDSRPDAFKFYDLHRSTYTRIPGVGDEALRPYEDSPLTFVEIKLGRQLVSVTGSNTRDPELLDLSEEDGTRVLRSIANGLR